MEKQQKNKTVTFDISNDNDFAALLFSFLKEKARFEKYNLEHPTLKSINTFLEQIEKVDKELYQEGVFFFEQGSEPIKQMKYYGKLCKACGYNIKAYYGKKENPCHRCGEIN